MALSLFIIPFLVFGFPDLALATPATSEWLIEIKVGKTSVGVEMRELGVIGSRS
jgi:hypothetical protein